MAFALKTVLQRDSDRGFPEERRAALVREVAAGSEAALEELHRRFQDAVYGLGLRILGDVRPAEEVAIEVFVRLWRRAGSYDPERGSVLAWMLSMARSLAVDELRARRRGASQVPLDEEGIEADALDPFAALQGSETSSRVDRALRGLPREQEPLLRAAFFGGLSYREVAEAFGQPLGTVKTRIRSALAALRSTLASEGSWE